MITRELTCIGCPMGCNLTVTLENDTVTNVTGNSCKIGIDYAHKECTHPTRIITTTVPVIGGTYSRLPIKTQSDIPKDKIYDCMKALKNTTVSAPINLGDIIYHNIAGTGINMIATQTITRKR